jgi:hypothetical protein
MWRVLSKRVPQAGEPAIINPMVDFGYPFDELAERVIKTEKERNIPIVEDVFEEILPELYGAVAKVLVYIKTLRT